MCVPMLLSAPAGTGSVFRAALIPMVRCSAFVQLLDSRAGGATEDGGPKSGRMRFSPTTQQVEILLSALICLLWWECNSSHYYLTYVAADKHLSDAASPQS